MSNHDDVKAVHLPGDKQWRVTMRGNGYHDRRPVDRMPRRHPFDVLLRREPENRHDTNAIAVIVDGERAGYVGQWYAARYAPTLDALESESITATAKVMRRNGAHDLYLDLLPPDALADWARARA